MTVKSFWVLVLISLLFTACSRKNKNETQEVSQNNTETQSTEDLLEAADFYVPALDNGDWVEGLLSYLEEERIADELESLSELEQVMKFSHSYENGQNEPVEIRLLDSLNKLKILEYGNEIFIPDFSDGKLVFINKCKSRVTRFFYDERYRLIKKEHWDIPDAENAKITLQEDYTYDFENVKPSSKTITTEESKAKTVYNQDGLPVVLEMNNYSTQSKRYSLINKTVFEYDSEKRITRQEVTDYSVSNPVTKTELYFYKDEEQSPDYEYYENGTLKIKTVYSSKNAYNTQIFFDDDFSVITYYEEGKKIKDAYYNGENFVREKLYE